MLRLASISNFKFRQPFLPYTSHVRLKSNHIRCIPKREYNIHKDPSSIKVTVAMSGGVDSAVSAYLLKESGYQVNGIFMRNWSEADEMHCSGQDDLEQVDRVCHFLKIPYQVVDFQKEYWLNVFEPVLEAYKSGETPNPDVLCNKEIKFKSLTDYVFGRHDAPHYLATGHYAQLRSIDNESVDQNKFELVCAKDSNKDQTYFLLQVSQPVLSRIIFPIGHLTKPEVRDIAQAANLPNATRKESMGLCFIGKRKFDDFLGEFTETPGTNPGDVKDITTGNIIAKHKGSLFFTVGQAASLSGLHTKMFVVEKDISSNIVSVCPGSHHPSLYKTSLTAASCNWILGVPPRELETGPLVCKARIRHRQVLRNCKVEQMDSNTLHVTFEEPVRAIATGQYIGFYKDDVCLGGGVIQSAGPSLWDQKLEVPFTNEERTTALL